jgi:hypothetical protein
MRTHFLAASSGRSGVLLCLLATLLPGLSTAQAINEQQELVASLTAGVGSGKSVSISGSTAVVGVPGDNGGAGDVYVFTRSGTTWTQQAILTASDATAGDNFGAAVSISGNSVAVGAPGRGSAKGAVYVFTLNGTWTQNATILTRGAAGDKLGTSVSVQGFVVAAGAPNATSYGSAGAGTAVVFSSSNGTVWSQFVIRENKGQTKANNQFGTSVSLSGNSLLVGSPNEKSGSKAGAGQTYVFVASGGIWRQQTRFSPVPSGSAANAHSGSAVALYVNTAVIGAPGTANGNAYVLTRTGTAWSAATALGAGTNAGDNYGASVAVSGTGIVVGAPLATNAGAGSGRAYEYTLVSGTTYALNELVATNNATGDNFGTSVAIDSGYALVGAPVATAPTIGAGAGDGAAYIFAPPPADLPTTTSITSISPEPSSIGQLYTVNVTVSATLGTPNGVVNVDDGVLGDTCAITLVAGAGNCQLANSVAGNLTINANYAGAGLFLPSTKSATHGVVGNQIVFMPAVMPNVLQDDRLTGVTVEVHDGITGNVVTSDNTTQVTVSTADPCGGADIVFGAVTVAAGIADFTGVGPRFYAQTSGGALQLNATSTDSGSAFSGTFDVVANAVDPALFADGFESCTL